MGEIVLLGFPRSFMECLIPCVFKADMEPIMYRTGSHWKWYNSGGNIGSLHTTNIDVDYDIHIDVY